MPPTPSFMGGSRTSLTRLLLSGSALRLRDMCHIPSLRSLDVADVIIDGEVHCLQQQFSKNMPNTQEHSVSELCLFTTIPHRSENSRLQYLPSLRRLVLDSHRDGDEPEAIKEWLNSGGSRVDELVS
jgi:hypothetical protein